MANRIGKIYTDSYSNLKYILFPYMQSSIGENILRSLAYSTTSKRDWYVLNLSKNENLTRVKFTSEEAREALRSLFRTDWSDEFG